MCEPYTSIKLPEITRIDRCGADGLSGETTAKPEAFIAAFKAAGFELGRDVSEPKYAADWFWAKKGGQTYRITATFDKVEQRQHPYFAISADQPRKWLPEATWVAIKTTPERREALLAKWRGVGDLLGQKAPKACPALDELDPAFAKDSTDLLLNLDGKDLSPTPRFRGARGPEMFEREPPSEANYSSMDEFVEYDARITVMSARRIVPVIRVTSFEDPDVPTSANILGVFTPGRAAFEVAVVDLAEHKVLCRSKAEARNSETIEATTTTTREADGTIRDVSTSADAHGDLAKNMRAAAFAELARMSPAFPMRTAAKLPKRR